MNLSDKHILQYQELYKKHFGKEISRKEAYEQGMKLIRLLTVMYGHFRNKLPEMPKVEPQSDVSDEPFTNTN